MPIKLKPQPPPPFATRLLSTEQTLTRGEIPAGVRHRLLAVEHRVRLHLVRRSGRQLLQIVRQRIVVN